MDVKRIYCPRCQTQNVKVKMKLVKRKGGFHKNTKFKCPQCSLIRMKPNKKSKNKNHY